MIKLFEFLFYGCSHKWRTFEERNLVGETYDGEDIIGMNIYCRCEKCGKPKMFRLLN